MRLRSPLAYAFAALVIAPAAQPGPATHAAWKWERAIVPNAASPTAEQCVVLDADLFARAAPGLRDVRLLQDGRYLAYAIDESVDEHTDGGANAKEDRSIYDTVATARFMGTEPPASIVPKPEPSGDQVATVVLPARVPVERLRLLLDDASNSERLFPATMQVTVFARPEAVDQASREAETVELQATPGHLLLPVTLGANLQRPADVAVHVDPASASLRGVALEMRRREICYQPLTQSPIALLFGNAGALPAHYDYGTSYQPKAAPLLASMGPAHISPAYRATTPPRPAFGFRAKLIVAMLACAFALVLTFRPLLRNRR